MKLRIVDALSLTSLLFLFALAAHLYPDLPEQMPMSWDPAGEVESVTEKTRGTAFLIAMPALVFLLLKYFPLIAPSGFRMTKSRHVLGIINLAVTVVLVAISTVILLNATGTDLQIPALIVPMTGALLVVLGNYMGKLQRNWLIGIRTPWTLASEEVWDGTHRVGRWVFVLAGLLLLVSPLGPWPPIQALLAVVIAAAIVSVGYSFVLYVKLHGLSGP